MIPIIHMMTIREKKRQTGKMTIYDKQIYIGQSSSGEIEIPLTGKQIKSICTIGENDIAVTEVSNYPKRCLSTSR